MDAKVTWKGQMKFEGLTDSGYQIPLDTGPESGGEGSAPRPMELVAVSLAGCTGMDVISILRKKRQEVTDFEVRVKGERASQHPTVFTHVVLEYVVTGKNIDPAAVERAIQLSAEKYCPVQAMLQGVEFEHRMTILEEVKSSG